MVRHGKDRANTVEVRALPKVYDAESAPVQAPGEPTWLRRGAAQHTSYLWTGVDGPHPAGARARAE